MDEFDNDSHQVWCKIRNALSLVKMHRKKERSSIESECIHLLEEKGFTYDASEEYLKWWIEHRHEHHDRIDWWDRKQLEEASRIVNWHPSAGDSSISMLLPKN